MCKCAHRVRCLCVIFLEYGAGCAYSSVLMFYTILCEDIVGILSCCLSKSGHCHFTQYECRVSEGSGLSLSTGVRQESGDSLSYLYIYYISHSLSMGYLFIF